MSIPPDPMPHTLLGKVRNVVTTELSQIRPRLATLSLVSRLLPLQVGSLTRANLLRKVGFAIGEGTRVQGTPRIVGSRPGYADNLVIGRDCFIEIGCHFDLGERITLEDNVTLGHQVLILTTSHELGPREHRAGPLTHGPVTIQRGAWIGPRSIILPGVTIGEGAIVSSGSLVNKNVEPNTRVAGMPAKRAESLQP